MAAGQEPIRDWLRRSGHEEYTPLFRAARVYDTAHMRQLTDDALCRMGVSNKEHRNQILIAAATGLPHSRSLLRGTSQPVPPELPQPVPAAPIQRSATAPAAALVQREMAQYPVGVVTSAGITYLPAPPDQLPADRQALLLHAGQPPSGVMPDNPAGPQKPRPAAVMLAAAPAVEPAPPASPVVPEYRAPPFVDAERGLPLPEPPAHQAPLIPRKYKRFVNMNIPATLVFVAYLISLGFYLWVRITKTLHGLKYLGYGIYILVVECLGATTVILYGINLLARTVPDPYAPVPDKPGVTKLRYRVRVMIPCYKESLDIVRRTIEAALAAHMPAGCSRTVYLCDDGRDPAKRKWAEGLRPDVVYVSGRKRAPGEMNGKSGNLNNCFSQIYPAGIPIPGTELVCIFDADQIAAPTFFLKTLLLFDGGEDVGMVLSPQCSHNINKHADLFNHTNTHFWEYMQPGYDALAFISCTGTNFLVRAKAFREAGMSPTYTLTEDFALGMEMKRCGWHCRYVKEYLAIGEAPDQIRNCYQQRSRWCKGHFQIIFNLDHTPLFVSGLSPFYRLLYCTGVWSYIVGALSTPTWILVPLINVWLGVFPVVVSRWMAVTLTAYSITTHAVLYHVHKLQHLEALWFANISAQILWWTYVKACWNALVGTLCGKRIAFKATLKGKVGGCWLRMAALRDLWLPSLCLLALGGTVGLVIYKVIVDQTTRDQLVNSPLAISVLWAFFNAVPPALLVLYVLLGSGVLMQFVCRMALLLSFMSGAAAVGLMWLIHTDDQFKYDGLLPLTFGKSGVTIPQINP